MPETYKNFTASLRKPKLIERGLLPPGSDLTWIDDAGFTPGSGGGLGALTRVSISGTINGTNGTDGNAVFTLGSAPDTAVVVVVSGVMKEEGIAFNRSGVTVTFIAPYIPITGDVLTAYNY